MRLPEQPNPDFTACRETLNSLHLKPVPVFQPKEPPSETRIFFPAFRLRREAGGNQILLVRPSGPTIEGEKTHEELAFSTFQRRLITT